MSKGKLKHHNLPKLQKRIVLCLANQGPMIIRETNTRIKGEYTSTNRAFHELENKEMITKVNSMSYRGRRFPKYWLTTRGSAFALLNNVNPEKVKLNALELGEKKEDKRAIQVYFKLREINPKIANILDRFTLLKGRLEPVDLFSQLLPEMVSMNENQIREIFGVAKKTEYWKYFEETLQKFIDEVREVLSHE